jgi:hypothetical protein
VREPKRAFSILRSVFAVSQIEGRECTLRSRMPAGAVACRHEQREWDDPELAVHRVRRIVSEERADAELDALERLGTDDLTALRAEHRNVSVLDPSRSASRLGGRRPNNAG